MKHLSGHRALFFDHLAPTSPFPLAVEIVDSKGVYLIDRNNNAIMDLICGISVSALGHKHPEITQAIHKQVDRYMHTLVYGEFVLAPQVQLAEKLVEVLPPTLNSVYFLNSGSEAIEAAIKLAIKATGRKRIMAAGRAYHGSTMGAMSLMSDPSRVSPFGGGILDVEHLVFNDAGDLDKIDDTTACVIMETVQAESGLHIPDKSYMQLLRQKCSEKGALLILDEIQAGMGRTGALFAFEPFEIIPDVLVLGKALGGGMPLSACISSQHLLKHFSENPILGHITTFGGHPVCCSAGLASLKIILRDRLWERAIVRGKLLDRLKEHKKVIDFRRIGLWAALELDSMDQVLQACKAGLDEGILIDWFLFNDHSIRICPPLNISEAELSKGVDALERVLNDLV